ncbi:HlyD family secretion protein [Allgaiera indica]|uniref:Membrane fusion protein, multidrug efflux system n=1 Tax=Allgaiera indica TaxID=765699 RepID=A0A1H3DJI3_9RHOB|nr:biotin/lipoyl-binding protein [Allgaiera indica]SDX66551.1 membrane fusion protein, multidrug efflux system [Allgaiera indica]
MKKLKLIAAAGLVLAIAAGLWFWWQYEDLHPSTQDAYLRAHIVQISAQVAGQVAQVDVHENQKVEKGEVLFRLDPAQYRNAYDAAKAQEKMAQEAVQSSSAAISAAEQVVASAKSALNTATQQLARSKALFAKGNISQSVLEQQQSAEA